MTEVHVGSAHLSDWAGCATSIALLLAAVGGGGYGCGKAESSPRAESSTQAGAAALEVAAAQTQGDRRPVTLTLDGTLVADEESRVTSVVPGRVMAVLVERGSRVAEGDPLVRLRDVDYRLAAEAAGAQLEQARARLGMAADATAPPRPNELPDVQAAEEDAQLAESSARRAEELATRGVLSPQGLEEARSRAASARERLQTALNGARGAISALESAKVALRQARTSASEAVVRAPFAGEIADRMVSVGEYVTPQSPLVTLVRTNPLRIELQVPQRYLGSVQQGANVAIQVDAVPGRTFTATVRYVSAAVRADTRSLTVEAVVPNEDGMLRPGLFATSKMSTGEEEQVAIVPRSAIHSEAGVDRAFVIDGGRVVERIVTIGDREGEGETVVVLEGVSPGERVAVEKLDQISDGMSVRLRAGNG